MSFQVSVWDPKNEGVFGSTQAIIQSLHNSQKDTVVQYQQLTKYDLKARKWQHIASTQIATWLLPVEALLLHTSGQTSQLQPGR